MIRIRDLSLPPDGDMARLVQAAARQLRISPNEIKQLDLKKKSVDARKKNDVRIIYTVDVAVKGREDKILKMAHSPKASIARDTLYSVPQPQALPDSQPIIVGFGPAGMFAALVLSMAGLRPLVLERGQDAKTRHEAVSRFWQTGELDPECNVQFGEGGAGTFSDGKLNTGVKNERIGWILEQFAEAGASADILYDAKPHIGTDELVTVVQNLREKILHYGGEIRFGTRLTGIEAENGRITAVRVQSADSETVLPASRVLLAIGHSARDTFEALHRAVFHGRAHRAPAAADQREPVWPVCRRAGAWRGGLQAERAAAKRRLGLYLLYVPRRVRGCSRVGAGRRRDERDVRPCA